MALFILTPMWMQTYFPKLLPMEWSAKCYTSNNLGVSVHSHSLGEQVCYATHNLRGQSMHFHSLKGKVKGEIT